MNYFQDVQALIPDKGRDRLQTWLLVLLSTPQSGPFPLA